VGGVEMGDKVRARQIQGLGGENQVNEEGIV